MDTPELGRLVVLQHALIGSLAAQLPDVTLEDPAFVAIMLESDALVFRIAQRCRSAIGYHLTPRGESALSDAARVVALAAADPDDFPVVMFTDLTWSSDQINGPIMPGMVPERRLERKMNIDGLHFVSPDLRV